jgi:glycosyltransferase involved in cell wall biosynthesis
VQIRLALDARKLRDFGIGTYLAHLIRGLAARSEVKLTLLVQAGQEDLAAELAPDAKLLSLSARGYSVAELVQVPAALWKERLELVHIPHYVVPPLLRPPTVVTIHDVIQLFYPPRPRHTLALIYLRAMIRSGLRRAARVITVSRASRRDLINLFGADPERLSVVANGVNQELATRPSEDAVAALKERYGLRSPLILVVANDKPHKNLDLVLRAFHLATRRHGIPGQLVFVGGPGEDHRLARRAEHLGMAARVRCLGRVPERDLAALYKVSAVLLHIALYEGFGLPVLEAMQAGLPVITANLGAMREVGEGSARLVNPLDVQEVAAALERVLVDDPLRRRMVEAGRRRAQSLTWENMVEGTVEVYRRAVGEGAG